MGPGDYDGSTLKGVARRFFEKKIWLQQRITRAFRKRRQKKIWFWALLHIQPNTWASTQAAGLILFYDPYRGLRLGLGVPTIHILRCLLWPRSAHSGLDVLSDWGRHKWACFPLRSELALWGCVYRVRPLIHKGHWVDVCSMIYLEVDVYRAGAW